MQFSLIILSVTCFACLIPSALSLNLLAARAVAGRAAEDIVSIGAQAIVEKKVAAANAASEIASIAAQGVALKGQAIKKAATSMAGTIINSAVSIGTTIAKAGLNMIAAKFSAKPTLVFEPSTIVLQTPVLQDAIVEETVLQEPVVVAYDEAIQVPIQIPSMSVDVRPQVWDIPARPHFSQTAFVEHAAPSFEIVGPANSPYGYDFVQTPQVYGPLMDSFRFGKK